MSSRIRAWDSLYKVNESVLRVGYPDDLITPNHEDLQAQVQLLADSGLTVAQINALENIIDVAYRIGRDS